MKRRGFFGVMAGAAVAGPSMAKQAVSSLSELAVTGNGNSIGQAIGISGYAKQAIDGGSIISELDYAKTALGKIVGITASQRAKFKRQQHVSQLDPDIASYRSLSLSAKIDMQRDRQLDAYINDRKSVWQRVLDGVQNYGEDDYLP